MRIVLSTLVLLAACGDDGAAALDAAPFLPDGGPPPIEFAPPKNPHLADSTWPIFHRDSYAQHSSELRGVEGGGAVEVQQITLSGIAIFVLFDQNDDILVVTKSVSGASLWKIDRETLLPVDSVELVSGGTFGGAYGYVDAQGRAVVGVGTRLLRYLATDTELTLDKELDLSPSMGDGELLVAITVLYTGEIAFVGDAGTVGVVAATLDAAPLDVLTLTDGKVSNGLTTDETGGIFVVTSGALRRIDWNGVALAEAWMQPVDAPFTEPRPGRLGTGSGTTPALMMDDMVAIADDAQSMNLMVVRRKPEIGDAPRLACKIPAFDDDATTDNAIVVAGRTMIIEQNLSGHTGVARFDVDADGNCVKIWHSDVNAPSCVPTLSVASGLVYVYTDDNGEWGLSGLDLSTGRRVFKAPAGDGGIYNNYYAAVTIGPDRRIYIGTIAGLLVFSDAP